MSYDEKMVGKNSVVKALDFRKNECYNNEKMLKGEKHFGKEIFV